MCPTSLIVLILTIFGMPAIFGENATEDVQLSNSTLQVVSRANSLFANDLYQVMSKIELGSLAISPYSLASILAMLRAGAGGDTGKDIQKGLHLENVTAADLYEGFSQLLTSLKGDPNVTIETANSIYVDKGFDVRDEFLDLLRTKFSAAAEALDFSGAEASAKKINTFVKDVTRNAITELVTPSTISSKDTKLILVNAIYFKGKWKDEFPINRTESQPFYTSEANSTEVMMMRQKRRFPYAKLPELNATAAMLPYLGDRFGLVIVLPDDRMGLETVESKLEDFPLSSIPERLKPSYLEMSLPRFKLASTMDYVKNLALDKLGMSSVLSRKADFTGITASNDLVLSQILQKSVVEINEEGTTAAAASAAILVNRVAHIGTKFVVDHPFLAFIYDQQTQNILFVVKKTN